MRALLVLAGVAIAGYGIVLLVSGSPQVMLRIAVWALVAALLHDLVFAPLCAALGYGGRRLIRGRWWTPVAVAGLCTVVLVLLAVPVYTRPGAHADNPTVLDRNYPLGLWISLLLVWTCVPAYILIAGRLPVRQDDVVEHQRTGDVEPEPPTV
jgi:hypothetical protein